MCLLMLAYYEQYSGIWGDLKNITLLVTDNYPKTLTGPYEVLWHFKDPAPQQQLHTPTGAVMFSHLDDAVSSNTVSVNNET